MAEILSPGVFVEEVPSQVQVIPGVSTSNLGTLGFTQRGPENVATLVTSFDDFTRKFGPIISESILPLSMAAYFSNGGRRAFIVRIVPADAVAADAKVDSAQYDQLLDTSDGATTAYTETDLTTTLKVNGGASPILPGSVTFSWREDGTPVVGENLRNRADDADIVQDSATQTYEFRIAPSSLPTIDLEKNALVNGSVTLNWTNSLSAPTTQLLADPNAAGISTTTTGQGSVISLDFRTGLGSLEFAGTDVVVVADDGANITMDFTPASETLSVTDDGLGVLPAGAVLTGPGSITYADGAYSFTLSTSAHEGAQVSVDYSILAWDLDPISKGTWANDMKFQILGDDDYYDAATATYSRYVANVLLYNTSTLAFDIVETYDGLSLTDSADAQYLPDVINELSDYMSVQEPAGDEAPGQLNGIAKSQVIAGGDEDAASTSITATLGEAPVAARTISISVYDTNGDEQTITDDGAGNLTGWVDATGVNTINYTTGAVDVKTQGAINGASLVVASYATAPVETVHEEAFSGGTNGTFDSTNYGRNQFSSAALLEPTNSGLYALNLIEELMQVTIPDFVGDVTITQDLVDYVDGRATLPSGGDRFAIIQPPAGSSAQEAVDWLRFDLNRDSRFTACYWPHVRVADPLANNRPKTIPAVNHIAGIYARTDATKNVGKAPGGTVDGALRFLTGLETDPTQGDRDFVYPKKINPLINSPQTGLAVWGVRTISSQSDWRYVNVRRLFMFVEKSVFNATHWIVFENNGPNLWTRIQAQLESFLTNLFNEGLLAGNSPSEAFFVTVDSTNNDANSIAAGQVIIDVGLAANTPAEFVRFRFSQITA